jgi:hypothetical protein
MSHLSHFKCSVVICVVVTGLNSENIEHFYLHTHKKFLLGSSVSKKKLFPPTKEEKMAKVDFRTSIKYRQNTLQTSQVS